MTIINDLKGKIIVSSQAMPDEPFYDEKCMNAMMQSVVNGGAGGLRVAGARDTRNAKKFGLPVIGLTKPDKLPENWKSVVYITPSLKEVRELIEEKTSIQVVQVIGRVLVLFKVSANKDARELSSRVAEI